MSEPERFRDDVVSLRIGSELMVAVRFDRRVIEMVWRGKSLSFTVPEARALYHWLGKVLPEEGA